MAEQVYPDGDFAKAAISLAEQYLFVQGKKKRDQVNGEEYLKAVALSVRALRGLDP
jgi:hypothetical protein